MLKVKSRIVLFNNDNKLGERYNGQYLIRFCSKYSNFTQKFSFHNSFGSADSNHDCLPVT